MLAWAILITLLASLCSAAMGAAWLAGARSYRQLWLAAVVTGAAAGAALSLWGGGTGSQIGTGASYGFVVGTGTWLLLWVGVRLFLFKDTE